jgi:hypothetical protein
MNEMITIRRILTSALVVAATTLAVSSPALAKKWNHHGWGPPWAHHGGYYDRGYYGRGYYDRPVVVVRPRPPVVYYERPPVYYERPPVYYERPPAYYAPPPPVYVAPAPGISVNIPLRFD